MRQCEPDPLLFHWIQRWMAQIKFVSIAKCFWCVFFFIRNRKAFTERRSGAQCQRVGDLKLQLSTLYANVENFFFFHCEIQTDSGKWTKKKKKSEKCSPIPFDLYAKWFEWGKHESDLPCNPEEFIGRLKDFDCLWFFIRSINLLSRFIYWFCKCTLHWNKNNPYLRMNWA